MMSDATVVDGESAERLEVDLLAMQQRVAELDRRVTALQLLTAADDARHVEQAVAHAASAASDLHKVTTLLGGGGLLDQLRVRVERAGSPELHRRLAGLVQGIDATRRRVARSAMLATASNEGLQRQIERLLGREEPSPTTYGHPTKGARQGAGPRLIDRRV